MCVCTRRVQNFGQGCINTPILNETWHIHTDHFAHTLHHITKTSCNTHSRNLSKHDQRITQNGYNLDDIDLTDDVMAEDSKSVSIECGNLSIRLF